MPHKIIQQNLSNLQTRIEELIHFYEQDLNFQTMIYELWNAKDILGHLTFWHESFARNIRDLGEGTKPSPLKGKLSEVNRQSVESTAPVSISALIARLQSAQKTIEQHIFDESIDIIPYKKGSRSYSREEHLEIVAAHIKKHLRDLKKKLKQ